MPAVSATDPDWTREIPEVWWDPARRLLRCVRDYQALAGRRGLRRRIIVLRHAFWSIITQAEIPLGTQIGGGLRLPHPNGIVIHPRVVLGPNCMIFQQVNLGSNRGKGGVPVIGGHVDIGPGARILGGVTVGDHAVIGANAVVLCDVPAGAVAVGVPARILPGKDRKE
jgi:serine O-acetyltransferase